MAAAASAASAAAAATRPASAQRRRRARAAAARGGASRGAETGTSSSGSSADGVRLSGTCLWYDTTKGYGLIEPAMADADDAQARGTAARGGSDDEGSPQAVFVHSSQLRSGGVDGAGGAPGGVGGKQRAVLLEGEAVEFVMGSRMGKPYAKDVTWTASGARSARAGRARAKRRGGGGGSGGGAARQRRGRASGAPDPLAALTDAIVELPAGAELSEALGEEDARRLQPRQLTTLFGMLKLRCSSERIDALLAHLRDAGVELNTFIYSAAVSALCVAARREGGTEGGERAERVVREMEQYGAKPNQVTFTALMHYHADRGSLDRALEVFDMLQEAAREEAAAAGSIGKADGKPDLFAYSTVMKACYQNATGRRSPGYGGELVARLAEQLEQSGQLRAADHSLLMLAIWGKGQAGDWEWGLNLVRERASAADAGGANAPRAPDLGLWNSAIAACSACEQPAAAAALASEVVSRQDRLDEDIDAQTLVNALGACRGGGAVAEAAAGEVLELMTQLEFSNSERCEVYEQAIQSLALPLKGKGHAPRASVHPNARAKEESQETLSRRDAAFALLERMRALDVPRRSETYSLVLAAQGGNPLGTWRVLRMMADDGIAFQSSTFKGAMAAISQLEDAALIDEMCDVAERLAEGGRDKDGVQSAQLFCAAMAAAGRSGDYERVELLRGAADKAFECDVPQMVLEAQMHALAVGCGAPERVIPVWDVADALGYAPDASVVSGIISSCRVNGKPDTLAQLVERIEKRERLAEASGVSLADSKDRAKSRSVWSLWSYAQAVGCFAEAGDSSSAVAALEALWERADNGDKACAISRHSLGECTTLLRALKVVGADKQAMLLLERMHSARVELDPRLYVASVEALASGSSKAARREACRLVSKCLNDFVPLSPYEFNQLVHASAHGGCVQQCSLLLERMRQEQLPLSIKCCNAAMAAMVHDLEAGVSLFDEMVEMGPAPDPYTYATLITAAGHAGEHDLVAELLNTATDQDVKSSTVTFSAAITALGRAGDIDGALAVLHELSPAAAAASEQGSSDADGSSSLAFAAEHAPRAAAAARAAISLGVSVAKGGWANPYNAAVTACGLCDAYEHVAAVRAQMAADGISETAETRQILVAVAAKCGHFDEALESMMRYSNEGELGGTADVRPYAHLAAAAGAAGDAASAERLLTHMRSAGIAPDAVVYSGLMRAHTVNGDGERASELFDEGIAAGVTPDVTMYHVLLRGVVRASEGSVSGTQHLRQVADVLADMRERGVAPDTKMLQLIDMAFDYDYSSPEGRAAKAELKKRLVSEESEGEVGADGQHDQGHVVDGTAQQQGDGMWADSAETEWYDPAEIDNFYSGAF